MCRLHEQPTFMPPDTLQASSTPARHRGMRLQYLKVMIMGTMTWEMAVCTHVVHLLSNTGSCGCRSDTPPSSRQTDRG